MNKTKFYTIIVLTLSLFFAQKNLSAQSIVGNNPAFGKWTLEKVNIIFPEGTSEEDKKGAAMFTAMFEKLQGKMSLEFFPSGKGIGTMPKSDSEEMEMETKDIAPWNYDAKNNYLFFSVDGKKERNKVKFDGKKMILTPAPEGQEAPINLEMIFNK